MGLSLFNSCPDNKSKMKLPIVIACLVVGLAESRLTKRAVQVFLCNGEEGSFSIIPTYLSGADEDDCSISIGGNSASGSYVCDRVRDLDDDYCAFFGRSSGSSGTFGSFGGLFGGGIRITGSSGGRRVLSGADIASGDCEYDCESDGSCEVSRAPGFKASCLPKDFGGRCIGTPSKWGCSDCKDKCRGRTGTFFY